MTLDVPSRAFVSLVGAGPGDPGLLTLRGAEALSKADVVLFDYLANPELLRHCPQAETVFVGKEGFSEYLSQEAINALMVERALEGGGQRVVRLKGGDVFVFGRGSEEALACLEAGIPFEVVPGVTSAVAAPAYAGIPVTHRGVARSFAVITGNTREGGARYEDLRGADTLLLLMGVRNLDTVARDLIASGRPPETPAATVQWGSTPRQRVAVGTLSTIAQEVERAGLGAPAVTVVGEVVKLREELRWFDLPGVLDGPLSGRRVAVTRTREGNSALADLLRARGTEVTEVPLIRFEPSGGPGLYRKLSSLNDYAWVVLTSNQGVEALFGHLDEMGQDVRAFGSARVAAVGPSTARSLEAHGLRPDFVPSRPGAAHLAAELPAAPGSRVLHPTSQLAEDALEDGLAARGVTVERAETYRTEPATPTPEELGALRGAEVVTLASGSAARNFAALAGTDFTVAVMGPQTEAAAREAGFRKVVVAKEPSLDALVEAAAEALRSG